MSNRPLLKLASIFCLISVSLMAEKAYAVVIPPDNVEFFLQTNTKDSPSNRGDWYTAVGNTVGGGAHWLVIIVPSEWPATTPIMVDLQSPEFNNNSASGDQPVDELFGGTSGVPAARYELFPGSINPDPLQPHLPASGTGISGTLQTFPYRTGAINWQRLTTITNPTPGARYWIRADYPTTTYAGDNGWRLRAASDNDSDPNNSLPANADNLDGVQGTGDELILGFLATTFQHNSGGTQCQTFYGVIEPNDPSVTFDNFDIDGNGRLRYYSPSATFDPNANTGGVAGTISGNDNWNGTGAAFNTRVGDTINNPEAGLWRIPTCVSNNNQFILESDADLILFMDIPRVPEIGISKTASVIEVGPSTTFSYSLEVANSSAGSAAGAARNVVVTDQLSSEVDFVSGSIGGGYTGSVVHSSGTVTFTINEVLVAGATIPLTVTVEAQNTLSGSNLVNSATVESEDMYGNIMPPDTDTALVSVDVLAVRLLAFEASAELPGAGPIIRWETAAEYEALSFDVYRFAQDPTPNALEEGVLVNSTPVPAQGSPVSGAAYEVHDPLPLQPGEARYYMLVETEISGETNTYGPARAKRSGNSTSVQDWSIFQ